MEALYLLIPLSVLLILIILVVLWKAIFSGQFDDLDEESLRILRNDDLDQDSK